VKAPSLARFKEPLPTDPLGQKLCTLFPYRWQCIQAPAPDDVSQKPRWQTLTKYPLRPRILWAHWQDAHQLIGVRFGHSTSYGLIDIDAGSAYLNSEAIAAIQMALETIGICRTLLIQSSWSRGLHLYIPLPEPVSTFSLALALQQCLKAQGFGVKAGQLETFPNIKSWGNTFKGEFTEYNAHRLPLQPGSGSLLLDPNLNPLPSGESLAHFFQCWDHAAQAQDLSLLLPALGQARNNHRKRPKHRITPITQTWRDDLEQEIAEGWSDHGQTNHLLKTIACYGVVFEGLQSEDLAEYIERIATSRPGYEQWCRHQHEIGMRSRLWARAAEQYYWPLGSQPKRQGALYRPDGLNAIVPFNQQRSDDAKARIQQAVEQLQQTDELPQSITERVNSIQRLAHVSSRTLYKHLELWHPQHRPEIQRCKTDQPERDTADLGPETAVTSKSPEARQSGEFYTGGENMKGGGVAVDLSSPPKALILGRGGSGGEPTDFPQLDWGPERTVAPSPVEAVQPLGADVQDIANLSELIAMISVWIRRLGWTRDQASQFIGDRFNGKRRAQLTDEELVLLLYYLQTWHT
jgi:hypothetical protein